MPKARSNDFIQSLERGLAVMNSFSRERRTQTLSEVAEMTGLTRATAVVFCSHLPSSATCTRTAEHSR